MSLTIRHALCTLAALLAAPAWAEPPAYRTQGQCDGLPAITSLQVAPEFCLALAASNLGRPRGVLALGPNHLLVTDMGNWNPGRGRLLELTREPGKPFKVTVLLKGLDRPHGLRKDAQGRVLLAETHRISQVELNPARLAPLIADLPAQGRHPLKSFVIDATGALLINVGSPSDHCEAFDGVDAGNDKGCPQTGGKAPWAAVWKYTPKNATAWEGQPLAWGLRNSVGLAIQPETGELWQAENSRDTLAGDQYDKGSPPDELNRVEAGKHYGWPHCTGNDVLDNSYGAGSCKDFTAPARLIPAHAAPLGMLFYGKGAPAKWQGSLVMTWHGYQPSGHRLMAWRFDDKKHHPVGEPLPLIEGWDAQKGKHPMGAPTDVDQDEQGRLWITEDRNGDLLLLMPRTGR
ncbi:PQQ-dependent sugar dehydrogenase [Roseateles sp. NT4]|uniref:PQQ-dependent sugar dehydrogenase n=1 Tax=Roseateles sp. NT4 TaxID=3453715 RepID=UPI003EED091E